jgi:ribosomal protein S18 acetylase RimI-like enzyme
MPLTYRLYRPSDAEQVNDLAHRVFNLAPFSADVWQRMEDHDHVTVVATEGDQILGAIPFDLRDFLIRPGLSIRAAFAHMVCVDEEYRDRGLGSGMLRLAREHLPQHCAAMFVYTGSEGIAPYTFYEKNGFVDLQYSRFYTLPSLSADLPPQIQIQPFDPAAVGEEALNDVYTKAYASCAGFPVHAPGYWQRALTSIIYVEIPTEFHIALVQRGEALAGYAIFGVVRGQVTILELAADPAEPSLIRELIQGVAAFAAAHQIPLVNMLASIHHPALPALQELGFQPASRANAEIIAGLALRFDRLWEVLTASQPPCGLHLWTPSRSLELPGPGKPVTLEMKESTLHRLFLCREDLSAALQAERITSPDFDLPLEFLQRIFQPTPWIFHWLAWI